jgi:hypothetical protein
MSAALDLRPNHPHDPRVSGGLVAAMRGLIALTAVVLLVDAAVSIWSGIYLNLGTGVWLGLARDVRDGVLYRPIWNGVEYGGTRYFPMLFVPIGGLMRLGLPAVPAGLIVSLGGLLALVVAVVRLLERWSVPPLLARLAGALVAAPYFVHETGFAVRCEPLAAAFAVSGLALLGPPRTEAASTRRLIAVAALFVAAFATKITCVYAPVAAVIGLIVAGRRAGAARLALFTGLGAALFLLTLHAVTQGRALDSFRACAWPAPPGFPVQRRRRDPAAAADRHVAPAHRGGAAPVRPRLITKAASRRRAARL